MINYYWIIIKGKSKDYVLRQIFKNKINIENIKYYDEYIKLKVSYEEYKKIKDIKTICDIEVLNIHGTRKIKDIISKYKVSLLMFIISIFFCLFLSDHIFYINIETNNKELKENIKEVLNNEKITIFSHKHTFNKLTSLKQKIKDTYPNNIEWIELEEKGVFLNINVIERVESKIKKETIPMDIVASKNGYIRKIYSKKGDILKDINDYVQKGEVIISGSIYKNEEIVDKVSAEGNVYGEVWYIVKLHEDLYYIDAMKKEKGIKRLMLNIGKKDITLFKIKSKVKAPNKKFLYHGDTFSLYIKKDNVYTKEKRKYGSNELEKILSIKAKKEINKKLDKDEYITYQKVLKKRIENGKMYMEVFFKVYESIGEKKIIKEEEIKEKEE